MKYRLVNPEKQKHTWRDYVDRIITATIPNSLHNLIVTLAVLTMFTILVLAGKVEASSPSVIICVCWALFRTYRTAQRNTPIEQKIEKSEEVVSSEQRYKLAREIAVMQVATTSDITQPMPAKALNGHTAS